VKARPQEKYILPPGSHTNPPKEYAATSDAHRKDTAQPHACRRIPSFALSVATTTLTKAHNSAPTSNAANGSPPGGVGGGIDPVLPMFCVASARQTNDVPTSHIHHKPTERLLLQQFACADILHVPIHEPWPPV
jgi:hypothetical protein